MKTKMQTIAYPFFILALIGCSVILISKSNDINVRETTDFGMESDLDLDADVKVDTINKTDQP